MPFFNSFRLSGAAASRVWWWIVLGGLVGLGSAAASASVPATAVFAIETGDAQAALAQFCAQSHRQVLVPSEWLAGVNTSDVRGTFTAPEALNRLLAATPLAAVEDSASGIFVLERRPLAVAATKPLNAAAVIAIGLAADEAQARRFRSAAEAVRSGLIARGIPATAIALLPASPATSLRCDTLLAAMAGVTDSVDETWLVLIGQASPGRDRAPSFQVSGPRVSASDLAAAVGALPGRRFVVLGAAGSGGFLPGLAALPDVEAVAATLDAGEINEPRFTALWAESLAAQPQASFRELAVAAATRVEAFYRERGLGQSEHSQLIERTTTVSPP